MIAISAIPIYITDGYLLFFLFSRLRYMAKPFLNLNLRARILSDFSLTCRFVFIVKAREKLGTINLDDAKVELERKERV